MEDMPKKEKYLLIKPIKNEEELKDLDDKIRELFEDEFGDGRRVKTVQHSKVRKNKIVITVEYE